MPFVSGAAVPSNRACSILTDGARAWNVTVRSTFGASAALPRSVTVQLACAWLVFPVNVPDDQSLQPISLVPTRKHMWVVPWGEVVASLAVTVPAPSLRKVTMRGSPPGSSVASSLSPTKVRVAGAARPGEPDGAALGLVAAVAAGSRSGVALEDGDALSVGVSVAPADGDPIAIGAGLGDAVAGAAPADHDEQRHGDDQHQQAGEAGHDGAQGSVAHRVGSSMRAGIVPDRRRHAARWSIVKHTTPGDHGRLIDRPASPCPVRPG